MASTPQGDVPGNRQHVEIGTIASVASNGANARLLQAGPFPWPVIYRGGAFTPTGADWATHGTASTSASFRLFRVFRGGPSGTVTATASIVGSLGGVASHASLAPVAFSTVSSQTIPIGDVVYFSQLTVGGNDNDGSILPAGQLTADFEIV
jgi:hypothetical protein